jgi:hypothetical protein
MGVVFMGLKLLLSIGIEKMLQTYSIQAAGLPFCEPVPATSSSSYINEG